MDIHRNIFWSLKKSVSRLQKYREKRNKIKWPETENDKRAYEGQQDLKMPNLIV
jgi:hypothetical protein